MKTVKEKNYPRMYYAGSPMPEVGDIIFQEYKDGPKTKLPVCTPSDLVPCQLIEVFWENEYLPKYSRESDQFLFTLGFGVSVFKRNDRTKHYVLVFDEDSSLYIDSTIPKWIFVKNLTKIESEDLGNNEKS